MGSFSWGNSGQVLEQGHIIDDEDIHNTASCSISKTQTPRSERQQQESGAEMLAEDAESPPLWVGHDTGPLDARDVAPAASSLSTTSSNFSSDSSCVARSPPLYSVPSTLSLLSADSRLSPISPSSPMRRTPPTGAPNHECGSDILSSGGDELLSITSDSPAEQVHPASDIPPDDGDLISEGTPNSEVEGSGFMSLNGLIHEGTNHDGGDNDNNGLTPGRSRMGKVVLLLPPSRVHGNTGNTPCAPIPIVD